MKLYSDLALRNEYLIRIRAQAQVPYIHTKYLGGGGGHQVEFEQNFTSTAGRQNKPFYEQNLSKPNL